MTETDKLTEMLNRLDALAAKATPGPWWTDGMGVYDTQVDETEIAQCFGERKAQLANSAYLAALDPGLVRALVGVARTARVCVDLSQPETQSHVSERVEAGAAAHAAMDALRQIAEARP